MISGMECACCGSRRPVAVMLRRNRVQRSETHDFQAGLAVALPAAAFVRHPLCEVCITWLASVIGALTTPGYSRDTPLLGAPGARSRVRIFPDQCHLCRDMLGDSGVLVDSITIDGGGPGPFPAMLVCGPCGTWIGGLADDGRSARGDAERAIDGEYGLWPHPNLRSMEVALRVLDRGIEAAIRESCRRMGVEVRDAPGSETVVFIEASPGGSATTILRNDREPHAGRILLVPLTAEADLRRSLEYGISSWLTIPVTPQQVSAALTGIARHPGLRGRWDPATALPQMDLDYLARPALAIHAVDGVSLWEAAWFTRRVTRGYDDIGAASGVVIVVPRAPASDLGRVETRISRALAGRCEVVALDPYTARHRRLEAAG